MLKEFKEFAMKGNVMDMAIGIIIGAAFGKIVSSFLLSQNSVGSFNINGLRHSGVPYFLKFFMGSSQ